MRNKLNITTGNNNLIKTKGGEITMDNQKLQTWTIDELVTADVPGRSGDFQAIRDQVTTMIKPGQAALLSQVVKAVGSKKKLEDPQMHYNYVRNAAKRWLVKQNGRSFVAIPVEPEAQ